MTQDRAEGTPATRGLDAERVAAALAPFLVQGPSMATRVAGPRTYATPQVLAVMLADLAARMVTLQLPDGYGLSLVMDFQPSAPLGMSGGERDAAEVAIVAAAAAALGAAPERRRMVGGVVHYHADAVTPPGLIVEVYTSVEPTATEREAAEAERQRRTERRDPGEVAPPLLTTCARCGAVLNDDNCDDADSHACREGATA